jgi:hypothetical protein
MKSLCCENINTQTILGAGTLGTASDTLFIKRVIVI